SLVTGDNPLEFAEQDTKLDAVHATTEAPARNARVNAPDGSAVWQTPVFDPDGPAATVDLRKAIEAALNKKLAAKGAPEADVTVTADAPAQALVSVSGPRGALVRVEQDVVRAVLEGDPVALPLSGPLDAETPASVTGDLAIRYSGIRILEGISDDVPGPGAALVGAIVGAAGAVRTLPRRRSTGSSPRVSACTGARPRTASWPWSSCARWDHPAPSRSRRRRCSHSRPAARSAPTGLRGPPGRSSPARPRCECGPRAVRSSWPP